MRAHQRVIGMHASFRSTYKRCLEATGGWCEPMAKVGTIASGQVGSNLKVGPLGAISPASYGFDSV